jgi:hypothetical protein
MATGTKGELANVNTSASILASLSHMAIARLIPVKRRWRWTANQQATDPSLKGLGSSDYLDLHLRSEKTAPRDVQIATRYQPADTRDSLSFTAERQNLAKPRASGEWRFGDPNAIGGDNVGTKN